MKKQIANDYEPSIAVEAMYVAGLHPVLDSAVSDLGKGSFTAFRVVPSGLSVSSPALKFEVATFWRALELLCLSPDKVDIWGVAMDDGKWRKVAEYDPSLDFPLVVQPDLLETPEFRDLSFAFRVVYYNELYNAGRYVPTHHEEALDYVCGFRSALHCRRGVLSPNSCVPGLYGVYMTKDGSIVGIL